MANTRQLGVRIDADLYDELVGFCTAHGFKPRDVITKAIEFHLARMKEKYGEPLTQSEEE